MTIKSPLAYNQIDHSHMSSRSDGNIDVKRTNEIRKNLMNSYNRLNNSPAWQSFKETSITGKPPKDAYFKNGKWIAM
jgi:hypothetical protein